MPIVTRGHWRIEVTRNILDLTPGEDARRTIDRTAAENLGIVRKWICPIMRHMGVGFKASMRTRARCLG